MINSGFDWNISDNLSFTSAVRYFTDQPVEKTYDTGTTTTFSHVNNMFYVDMALLLKNVCKKGFDIQIAGKNILDNDEFVAGPWLTGQYRPCGASIEIRAYGKF